MGMGNRERLVSLDGNKFPNPRHGIWPVLNAERPLREVAELNGHLQRKYVGLTDVTGEYISNVRGITAIRILSITPTPEGTKAKCDKRLWSHFVIEESSGAQLLVDSDKVEKVPEKTNLQLF